MCPPQAEKNHVELLFEAIFKVFYYRYLSVEAIFKVSECFKNIFNVFFDKSASFQGVVFIRKAKFRITRFFFFFQKSKIFIEVFQGWGTLSLLTRRVLKFKVLVRVQSQSYLIFRS